MCPHSHTQERLTRRQRLLDPQGTETLSKRLLFLLMLISSYDYDIYDSDSCPRVNPICLACVAQERSTRRQRLLDSILLLLMILILMILMISYWAPPVQTHTLG